MTTLQDKLTDSEARPRVLEACQSVLDAEVASKPGLGGMAIKGAYRVVKAVKPGIVPELIDAMLPEFAEALEPMHAASHEGGGGAFASYLESHDGEAAEALLGVTDRRAERAKNKTLKKTYAKLRGTALQHVTAAVPGLGRALAPFV